MPWTVSQLAMEQMGKGNHSEQEYLDWLTDYLLQSIQVNQAGKQLEAGKPSYSKESDHHSIAFLISYQLIDHTHIRVVNPVMFERNTRHLNFHRILRDEVVIGSFTTDRENPSFEFAPNPEVAKNGKSTALVVVGAICIVLLVSYRPTKKLLKRNREDSSVT